MTRETIYAALFAFFSGLTTGGSPSFKMATRNLRVWENVAPEDQPALLQVQKREALTRTRGLPSNWTLEIELYVYVHTSVTNDPSVVSTTIVNPLLDTIEASFVIDDVANNACTLGGLVSHCYIDGSIEIFEGSLGDQAVAIIPISIVVPT